MKILIIFLLLLGHLQAEEYGYHVEGVAESYVHPSRFSFFYPGFDEKKIDEDGQILKAHRSVPRVKYFDNPELKGEPVVDVRDDGLYENGKKVCRLNRKNAERNPTRTYCSEGCSMEIISGILTKKQIDHEGIESSMINTTCKALVPFPKQLNAPFEEITVRFNHLYADEFKNGIAMTKMKNLEVHQDGSRDVSLDKKYYFRPSDYGQFVARAPGKILLKEFLSSKESFKKSYARLLGCSRNSDLKCFYGCFESSYSISKTYKRMGKEKFFDFFRSMLEVDKETLVYINPSFQSKSRNQVSVVKKGVSLSLGFNKKKNKMDCSVTDMEI